MKFHKLQIIPTSLEAQFKSNTSEEELKKAFEKLQDAELSNEGFSFYTSVASVYSSKIEGENIELDSYVKHKRFGVQFQPDYTRKVDDLYVAYQFANGNPPNKENIGRAHAILAKHIVAASPFEVSTEMDKFFSDLEMLNNASLTFQETSFFASILHLVFVKIHPWNDGNGRTARLLEKWFLASKLGQKAWFVQSEKFYYVNHQQYYHNIRQMGFEYQTLDYEKALPFLLMLPTSLTNPTTE